MGSPDNFEFNANKYFHNLEEYSSDSDADNFFEMNAEENGQGHVGVIELSDSESDNFFSPNVPDAGYSGYNKRRSMSLNDITNGALLQVENQLTQVSIKDAQSTGSNTGLNRLKKVPSNDRLNKLAKPKHSQSQNNVNTMTLAESTMKFERATPKRFRSKAPVIKRQLGAARLMCTKAKTPNLCTTRRTRPVTAITQQERELLELEEAKKFKIRANPLNPKIFKGPIVPVVQHKTATVVEPFHLTEPKPKPKVEEVKPPIFKAQPLPKSLNQPFHVLKSSQPPTEAHTPNFSQRFTKTKPKPPTPVKAGPSNSNKPCTITKPKPFSFEKRDLKLAKKKEEMIKKILEEEKRAREFQAHPVPKEILKPRNKSLDILPTGTSSTSLKSFKHSAEELREKNNFKARPATVLLKKPFQPKLEDHNLIIEPFNLATEQRVESRQSFVEKLKDKEKLMEKQKKEHEKYLMELEEQERARIRREADFKAQPIKKYKPVTVVPANQVTEPKTPKFHTDRIRNKENIQD